MEIKQFRTGSLNYFSLFYGNVKFSYDESEKVYEALRDMKYEVEVDEEVAKKAKKALDRMMK